MKIVLRTARIEVRRFCVKGSDQFRERFSRKVPLVTLIVAPRQTYTGVIANVIVVPALLRRGTPPVAGETAWFGPVLAFDRMSS